MHNNHMLSSVNQSQEICPLLESKPRLTLQYNTQAPMQFHHHKNIESSDDIMIIFLINGRKFALF